MHREEYGNNEASFKFFKSQNIPTSSTILDIGCNIGTLLHHLYNHDYKNIFGVDINKTSIQYGQEKYTELENRIRAYDGSNIPYENESFDVVMSFDVIEHIPDVDRHFKEVKRILKPGGIYLFQTPNKVINVPWQVFYDKHPTKWKSYHCSLHTPMSLKKRISKHDFALVSLCKQDLATEYNKNKARKSFGSAGVILISIFDKFPLFIFPHLWCVIKKKK